MVRIPFAFCEIAQHYYKQYSFYFLSRGIVHRFKRPFFFLLTSPFLGDLLELK